MVAERLARCRGRHNADVPPRACGCYGLCLVNVETADALGGKGCAQRLCEWPIRFSEQCCAWTFFMHVDDAIVIVRISAQVLEKGRKFHQISVKIPLPIVNIMLQ